MLHSQVYYRQYNSPDNIGSVKTDACFYSYSISPAIHRYLEFYMCVEPEFTHEEVFKVLKSLKIPFKFKINNPDKLISKFGNNSYLTIILDKEQTTMAKIKFFYTIARHFHENKDMMEAMKQALYLKKKYSYIHIGTILMFCYIFNPHHIYQGHNLRYLNSYHTMVPFIYPIKINSYNKFYSTLNGESFNPNNISEYSFFHKTDKNQIENKFKQFLKQNK